MVTLNMFEIIFPNSFTKLEKGNFEKKVRVRAKTKKGTIGKGQTTVRRVSSQKSKERRQGCEKDVEKAAKEGGEIGG